MLTDETMGSISHPIAYGVGMLFFFLHWMAAPVGTDGFELLLHVALDVAVLGSMGSVSALLSCGGRPWHWLLWHNEPKLSRAWSAVHYAVVVQERPAVILARVCAFFACCAVYVVATDHEFDARVVMAELVIALLGTQVVLLLALRWKGRRALQTALEDARRTLSTEQFERLRVRFPDDGSFNGRP